MVDMYNLSALVGRLMAEGSYFDPCDARELFENLPDEGKLHGSLHYVSSSSGEKFSGLTNAGPASFDETTKSSRSFGAKKGTWVGRWRITRAHNILLIEPRFQTGGEMPPIDSYELVFRNRGRIDFLKTFYRFWEFRIPLWPFSKGSLVFAHATGRFRPWKKPRKEE